MLLLAFLSVTAAQAQVQVTIDSSQDRHEISPYIYGSNSNVIDNRTLDRAGGNRWSGYNWETNASNAGADWYHHSDYFLTGGQANLPPGAAVEPMITAAGANDRAAIVTVPMAGYVAADANGTVDETEIAPSARWHEVVAKKSDIYPGSPLSLTPNENDDYVFTDEFANWAENTKQTGQPLFYSLDNEPALWGETLPPGWDSGEQFVTDPSPGGRTHPTIHPYEPTFVELRDKTIAHAGAIKDVAPDTMVFGGVLYGWNAFTTLQNAPDKVTNPSHAGGDEPGEMHYVEWLLKEVAAEEAAQGRKLMDVIDLHWYPEAQGGGQRITSGGTDPAVVEARVQAPRSLWDPTYTETSWITQWSTQGPIKLLPRLQRDIDEFNPGTEIAITEYNYGAGNHISGGIAQADVLGIFGREDVFAASWWNLGGDNSYVNAAFDLYRDFDGAGSTFGDTSVSADTADIEVSSVYASVDENNPYRMVVVLINRSDQSQDFELDIEHEKLLNLARVFQVAGASSDIVRLADLLLDPGSLDITTPGYSMTTLELLAVALAGDANKDGIVDSDDFSMVRDHFGQTGEADGMLMGDANFDGRVDARDLLAIELHWGDALPLFGGMSVDVIPEPGSAALLSLGALALRRRRRPGAAIT